MMIIEIPGGFVLHHLMFGGGCCDECLLLPKKEI